MSSNILFIVEGEQLEPNFLEAISRLYNFKCEVTSVKTNIHNLYRCRKEEDGFLDVKIALREILQDSIAS